MSDTPSLSLAGQTLRWKFDGGPTGDKTYEHTFGTDGTVAYHEVADEPGGASPAPKAAAQKPRPRYASFEVAPGHHLVSYLGDSGFTLTVLVDLKRSKVYGFASGAKDWYPLTGVLVD
jgi:hypothetical protein